MSESLSRGVSETFDPPTFAGAREPDRWRRVYSLGISLQVAEWGDADADPILLCHGFWDHLRSFALLAPILAEKYRVIAMDTRGHGDSDWGGAYSWRTWVTDLVHVIHDVGRPLFLVGHSMSGGQTSDAASAVPDLVRKLVNIDGFGPPPLDGFGPPPLDASEPPTVTEFGVYLNYRRRLATRPDWKPYATLDDLVQRRRRQNPRLSEEWLRYFLYWGARRGDDGWRWKADPQMAVGMGPWTPDWIGPGYASLRMPVLAIIGSEPDTWGPLPESILAERLRYVSRLERATVAGAGHFVHIEQPRETARVIDAFISA